MKKNILLSLLTVFYTGSVLAQDSGLKIMTDRCRQFGDILNSYSDKNPATVDGTSAGRNLWFKKCYGGTQLSQQIDEKGIIKFQYGQEYTNAYVTLGYVNPNAKTGEDPIVISPSPSSASLPCKTSDLEKYQPIGVCVGGCYERDQEILFEDGAISIGSEQAKAQNYVATLSKESTLENPTLQMTPMMQVVTDRKPELQDILEIQTNVPGKYSTLKVTTNHPLVVGEGYMKRANEIKLGDKLIRYDGSLATVLNIKSKQIYDRVYNVMVASGEARENIVIGQGYLNGSIYFQNGDFERLNRELVRASDTFIKSNDLRGSK